MAEAEIIAALSNSGIGNIEGVERIKHGLTNESWLARTATGAVVVRLSNTSETSLQINRRSEALILDVVARAGIGPDVIRCDPQHHVLVTRYGGDTWTADQATAPVNIGRIATLLRRLHQLSAPSEVQVVDLLAVTEGYLTTLDQHGVSCAVATPELRKRALHVAAMLRGQSVPALCHNDVHALNIVDDGTLRLIDWEYAGLGERLFDLASISVYHKYPKSQRELLLANYLDAADAQAWHRLELCCWLFDYIRDLWTAVRELQ